MIEGKSAASIGSLASLPAVTTTNARVIAFAGEGRRWAVIERRENDYAVRVFDDATTEKMPVVAFDHHEPFDLVLAFAPGGDELLAGDSRVAWRNGKVLSTAAFGKVIEPINKSGGRMAKVWSSSAHTAGTRMAVFIREEFRSRRLKGEGPADYSRSSVHLVDAKTGAAIANDTRRFAIAPFAVSANHLVALESPQDFDGQRTGKRPRPVLAIWSGDSGDALRRTVDEVAVTDLAFDATGSRLATAHGGSVTLWSVPDFCPQARFRLPDGDSIEAMAFAPRGLLLATRTGRLELWSVDEPGVRLASAAIPAPLPGGTATITESLAVSADGSRALLLLNIDVGVRLFSLAP